MNSNESSPKQSKFFTIQCNIYNRRQSQQITAEVRQQTTVRELKNQIENKTHIDSCEQILTFNGREMNNRRTLESYEITPLSQINVERRIEDFDDMVCVKPVILLYNDELKRVENEMNIEMKNEIENVNEMKKCEIELKNQKDMKKCESQRENVSVKLTLNNAMDIGSTYPNPIVLSESEMKKEYEWKGSYISNGNESCCQLIIDNKKFDYLFWEGQCLKKEEFVGEVVGVNGEKFEEEMDILLERLGLNERERNDFIVYWLTKLTGRKVYKVTICNEKYDNEIAKLEVSGFTQIMRVMLKFEQVNEEVFGQLKGVETVEKRKRPTGKYVIEWGGILP